MRALMFLALLGVAAADPFTAAVQAATAEHQRLYAMAAAAAAAAPDDPVGGHYHHAGHHQYAHHGGATKWTGPPAATQPAGVGGVLTPVADTPDVAAARAKFFQTYQNALGARPHAHHAPAHAHHQSWSSHGQSKWRGALASSVPAGLPGSVPQVQDTPEVAAARAQFFQAYNRAG